MSDYPQRVTDSFNERKRLIRLRRKKENLRFWEEFRIIPRWLLISVIVLFLAAQAIALMINLDVFRQGTEIFPPELKNNPALASLALAGIVTAASLGLAIIILVLLVRTLLHPITKRSQVKMMQMGKLAPEVEKLKKKYADQPDVLNREMMQLYKQNHTVSCCILRSIVQQMAKNTNITLLEIRKQTR